MNSNSPAALNRLEQDLRGMVCRITGLPENFDAAAHLYLDLGVASLHALELLTAIEERYSIHLPDEQFVEATSLAKIATLVQDITERSTA
jgi:acyl carrier protein